MSRVTKNLIVSPLQDGRNWQLCKQFVYYVGGEQPCASIKVPKGFITDFASTDVLQWFAIFISLVYAGVVWFLPHWTGLIFLTIVLTALLVTPYGTHGIPAVLHDWLYETQPMTRKQADRMFLEAMIGYQTPLWRAQLMYFGVRIGGWLPWQLNKISRSRKARRGAHGST